jgi:hypothetical protein
MSFGIRGEGLEAEGWSDDDDQEDSDEEAHSPDVGGSTNERTGLIRK